MRKLLFAVLMCASSLFAQTPQIRVDNLITGNTPWVDIRSQSPAVAISDGTNSAVVALALSCAKLKPIMLSSGTYKIDSSISCASAIDYSGGGQFTSSNASTLTLTGPQSGSDGQRYGGNLVVSFTGNYYISEVYPQHWGAKGDKSTDDTVPINAALATGKKIVINSQFKISNIAASVAGTTIEGRGWNTGFYSTHVYADGPTDPIMWIKADNITVRNLTVGYITTPVYATGYVNSAPVSETHPISVGWENTTVINNALIDHVYIASSLCHGIAIGYGSGSKVLNSTIVNVTATGINGEMASAFEVRGNHIVNSRDNGIYMESRAATQTTYANFSVRGIISNNIVESPQQGGIGIDTSFAVDIISNLIDNTYTTPISATSNHPSSSTSWSAVKPKIIGNTVTKAFANFGAGTIHATDTFTDGTGYSGMINVWVPNASGPGQFIVSGNILESGLSGITVLHGILVYSGYGGIINGNSVKGYGTGAAKNGTGVKIGLNGTNNCTNIIVGDNISQFFAVGYQVIYGETIKVNENQSIDADYHFWAEHSANVSFKHNQYKTTGISTFFVSDLPLLYKFGNDDLDGTDPVATLPEITNGTWDATITTTGGSVTVHPSFKTARYTKIGKTVFVHGLLLVQSVSSPTGSVLISLPFTTSSAATNLGSGSVRITAFAATAIQPVQVLVPANSVGFNLEKLITGSGASIAGDIQANSEIYFTVVYESL